MTRDTCPTCGTKCTVAYRCPNWDCNEEFLGPTPLPRPEIDVERLARALHHTLEAWPTVDPALCLQGPGYDLRRAERVLAAYNREEKQG